ncbi:hypothetical protein BKA80DRAFT_323608, partial [Phyllosticta citrichinensis]
SLSVSLLLLFFCCPFFWCCPKCRGLAGCLIQMALVLLDEPLILGILAFREVCFGNGSAGHEPRRRTSRHWKTHHGQTLQRKTRQRQNQLCVRPRNPGALRTQSPRPRPLPLLPLLVSNWQSSKTSYKGEHVIWKTHVSPKDKSSVEPAAPDACPTAGLPATFWTMWKEAAGC